VFIRDVKSSDIAELEEMLSKEDINRIGGILKICVDKDIVGFFSYVIIKKVPFLWHFCIKREYRSFKNAHFLIKEYRKCIKNMGYNKTLILLDKDYLCKLVERYFKTMSLGEVNGKKVYYVGV